MRLKRRGFKKAPAKKPTRKPKSVVMPAQLYIRKETVKSSLPFRNAYPSLDTASELRTVRGMEAIVGVYQLIEIKRVTHIQQIETLNIKPQRTRK